LRFRGRLIVDLYAILELVIQLTVDVLFGAAFLWLGMKFTARVIAGMQAGANYCSWSEILLASVAAAIAYLVPGVFGWALSWIVLFVLLIKFTGGTFLEVAIIVFFSRVAAIAAHFLLMPYLMFGGP
jgi:hypothetical protein